MKKHLLLFFALIITSALNAQVIFYEDFDGVPGPTAGGAGTYSFPAGWLLRNVDNRTPDASVAYVNQAWERREDFAANVIDSAAFSTSYYSPVGSADDWMWTPLIGPLPNNSILSWNAKSYDQAYQDGYEVRLMFAPNAPTGGTGVIGNQLISSTQIFSVTAENSTLTNRSVSLNNYSGQSVYIGFRNNSNDKFILVIDDVKVEVIQNFDASIQSIDTLTEYTQIPLSQTQPINLSGNVSNLGLQTLTGLKLNANVYNSNNLLVHSNYSDTVSLSSTSSIKLSCGSFTPVDAGNYTVKFFVNMNQTDELNSNDTMVRYFTITDSTYARDNGQVNGNLGIGAGNGYMGQSFKLVKNDMLTSVTAYFTRGYQGRRLAAVLWDMVNKIPNQIVASTDTLTYIDNNAGYYTLSMKNGFALLDSGEYAITFIEFDSTLALGQSSELFSLNTTWVDWSANPKGDWANFEYFGPNFQKACMIRLNFGEPPCNLNINVDTIFNVSCFNKEDAEIYLNVTGYNEPLTYTWVPNVSDTSYAINLGAGNYKVFIIDGFNCADSLEITITQPDEIDTSLTILNNTIHTNAIANSYQWINCDNGAIINNATDTAFSPSANGNYAVIIYNGVCIDTSECINFVLTSIIDKANDAFKIFPNPNNGEFFIQGIKKEINCYLYNSIGVLIDEYNLNLTNNYSMKVDNLSPGVYVIYSNVDGLIYSEKIIIK